MPGLARPQPEPAMAATSAMGRPRRRRQAVALLAMVASLPFMSAVMAQMGGTPAGPDSSTPLPDLAARFEVRWAPTGDATRVQQWQLVRVAGQISWIKPGGLEEIWRQDAVGIRLERVLRQRRHVIDYSAGELRALGVALDWRELGSLVSESALARLQRLPDDGPWHHHHGRLGDDQVDLLWDPVARLPQRLQRQGSSGQVVYQRLAVLPAPPADWPVAGANTQGFERIDAADFGDLEKNPVVRQELARDQRAGWRPLHVH